MPASWKIFRVICFLQMLLTIYFSFTSLINVFIDSSLIYLLYFIAFLLSCCLAILGINILNNNYPDKPIAGQQKGVFNWLFLLNFLLLAFLFGITFSEYRQMKMLSRFSNQPILSLPFSFLSTLVFNIVMLAFQITILYGLYTLRRNLYMSFFRKKQFEFEEQ